MNFNRDGICPWKVLTSSDGSVCHRFFWVTQLVLRACTDISITIQQVAALVVDGRAPLHPNMLQPQCQCHLQLCPKVRKIYPHLASQHPPWKRNLR